MSGSRQAVTIADLKTELSKVVKEKNNLLDALQLSPMALCHQDLELRYTWLRNPHMGFSIESSLGKTDWDLLDKDIADKMGDIKRRVIRTGVGERVEIPTSAGETNSEYFELSVEPLCNRATGEIVGITCAGMDVTEDRRRREAYRSSEENLRFIFNASPIPIVVLEQKTECPLFFNKAAAMMFNLSVAKQPTLGEQSHSLLKRLSIEDIVHHSLSEGKDLIDHTANFEKDNVEKFISVSATSIFYSGKPTILATFHDLTEQFKVEKQLREMNLELERRVEQRTSDLVTMNTALSEAKRLAEASSDAKSEFLTRMSHEIRTPINGILGMLQLVETSTQTPEHHDCINAAIKSGEALLVLVNDLLDFSKIEAGSISINESTFDLRSLIDSLIEMVMPQTQSKGLTVSVIVDPSLPTLIECDKGRLGQILINLLSNAVKFTESGGVAIEIVPINEGTQTSIQFSIADSGIGIPDDAQHRIFDAFYQVNESITRKYGGTGLGLRICQQLVDVMRGKIGFHSTQGRGTTFWFTLPIPYSKGGTKSTGKELPITKGMRILIVSNESPFCDKLTEVFESWGSLHHVVDDTEVARTLLSIADQQGRPYDLLVLAHPLSSTEDAPPEMILETVLSTAIRVVVFTEHLEHCKSVTEGMVMLHNATDSKTIQSSIFQLFQHFPLPPGSAAHDTTGSKPLLMDEKLKILVVEDNDINQRVMEKMLVRLGYRVKIAEDGVAALVAYNNETFDLILMDCHMPHLDGYSTARYIREKESEKEHITIIAVTANVQFDAADQCRESGMDDYMSKPVRLAELSNKLKQWLDTDTARRYRGEKITALFDTPPNNFNGK
jgi:signal transduction histidine kinase/CheY-like chemotaxis protein